MPSSAPQDKDGTSVGWEQPTRALPRMGCGGRGKATGERFGSAAVLLVVVHADALLAHLFVDGDFAGLDVLLEPDALLGLDLL